MNGRSQAVAQRLASGPARGLGCANTVAAEALRFPSILHELVAALRDSRTVVAARAANALKKVGKSRPELLLPHARVLLRAATECEDLQTRWNLVVVIGSLPLQGTEKALAVELLFEALGGSSVFLRTFAMTGLVNLALGDRALRRRVQPIVEKALEDPSAAMRARARKLLKGFTETLM